MRVPGTPLSHVWNNDSQLARQCCAPYPRVVATRLASCQLNTVHSCVVVPCGAQSITLPLISPTAGVHRGMPIIHALRANKLPRKPHTRLCGKSSSPVQNMCSFTQVSAPALRRATRDDICYRRRNYTQLSATFACRLLARTYSYYFLGYPTPRRAFRNCPSVMQQIF